MISMAINPQVNFMELTIPPEFASNRKITDELKVLEREIYHRLSTSRFYSKIGTPIEDWGICGIGILSTERDGNGRPIYDNHHIAVTYIDTNRRGDVDVVVRELKMDLSEVVMAFEVDSETEEKSKNNPQREITIWHAVIPQRLQRAFGMKDSEKWTSLYYTFDLGDSDGTVLRSGQFTKFPYKILRMNHSKMDPYGQGFVQDFLGDVKVMNELGKTEVELGHMNAHPAMDIPQERKGKEVLKPGGKNYYMDTDRLIRPIHTGSNYQIPESIYDRRAMMLDDYMFVSFFQMLANIQRTMTAFEVQQRLAEKAAQMSPLVEELHLWLEDIIEDEVQNILDNDSSDRFSPELKSGEIRVDFVSPMARLQRRLFEEADIRNFIEFASMIAQFDPTVPQRIRGGNMLDDIAMFYRIKGDYVKSEAEYQKEQKEAMQQQAAMQQAQMQNERMKAQADMMEATRR